MLPKELSRLVPKDHLMTENEWRSIGVQQSRGWVHYMIHEPGKRRLTSILRVIFIVFCNLRATYVVIQTIA